MKLVELAANLRDGTLIASEELYSLYNISEFTIGNAGRTALNHLVSKILKINVNYNKSLLLCRASLTKSKRNMHLSAGI